MTEADPLRFITLDSRPDLDPATDDFNRLAWPEFILNGNIREWHRLYDTFPAYQTLGMDAQDPDRFRVVGLAVPFDWNGDDDDLPGSLDAVMTRALQDPNASRATTLCALSASADRSWRGRGLAHRIVREMTATARRRGIRHLVAPVRPSWKARFPLEDMDVYLRRTRTDGSTFDPWVRVHEAAGARRVRVMPEAYTVQGSREEWQQWTGLPLEGDGPHLVPEGLVPVMFEGDRGLYVEPNVWMVHTID